MPYAFPCTPTAGAAASTVHGTVPLGQATQPPAAPRAKKPKRSTAPFATGVGPGDGAPEYLLYHPNPANASTTAVFQIDTNHTNALIRGSHVQNLHVSKRCINHILSEEERLQRRAKQRRMQRANETPEETAQRREENRLRTSAARNATDSVRAEMNRVRRGVYAKTILKVRSARDEAHLARVDLPRSQKHEQNRQRHFVRTSRASAATTMREQLQQFNRKIKGCAHHLSAFQQEQLAELKAQCDMLSAPEAERKKLLLEFFDKGLSQAEGSPMKMQYCEMCSEKWFDMRMQSRWVGGRQTNGGRQMTVCGKCAHEIAENSKHPTIGEISSRSVDNDMDPGPIPPELHGLTPIEQRLIARYVTYVAVKRLPKGAIGYSGHSIHFKQDIEPMAQQLSANGGRLPRNVEDAGMVVIRKVSHLADFARGCRG